MNLKKKPFSLDLLNFEKLTGRKSTADQKRRIKNSEIYIEWLIATLPEFIPEGQVDNYTIENGYKLNALCVYMNQSNVDKLSKLMDEMNFLGYGPVVYSNKTDPEFKDELVDLEYGIDLDELFSSADLFDLEYVSEG